MYDVSGRLPVGELRPGTNVLVTGPAMSGKYDLCCALLRDGLELGDGALVVTTQNDAGSVREAVRGPDTDTPTLGIVDCVSKERGVDPPDHDLNRFVSSPGEFTGIGMASSRLLEEFAQRNDRTRVALDSISQLLMYADVKTVFRFLHILTGRISAAQSIGFATLDESAHDEQTVNTVRQLFDGMVQTRTGEDGRELRVVGLGGEPTAWTAF
ncbi:RAD55 family ATPase [Haloarchaeobius amylolyticus]|uniref:RAD55 family ATPase n=1 Tax=Haloarchaeobius amylolyticus TaxID=1198296 RepID=UPI00226F99CF|nr:recombinase RecA [Haloarchaeobius amylolyticus]